MPRMVWIVIGCNCLIALIALWSAWQLVKLRQILRGVSRALLDAERSTHGVLGGAPEVIIIGQRGWPACDRNCLNGGGNSAMSVCF